MDALFWRAEKEEDGDGEKMAGQERRQADTQIDGRTDGQTDRQAGRQTDR